MGLLDLFSGDAPKPASASTTGGVINAGNTVAGLLAPDDQMLDGAFKDFQGSDFLVVDPRDWYKIFPYQFVIRYKKDDNPFNDVSFTYTLTIPPESMTTRPMLPSEATATFGGVTEETSETKFWVIQMAGTTGMAVSRLDPKDTADAASVFRTSLTTTGLLSGLNANVNAVGSQIVNGINSIENASGPGDLIANAVGGITEPSLMYGKSAVSGDSNGYSEINRLHKFFYMYTVLHEKAPTKTTLHFFNNKDAQSFRIVVKEFMTQKSVQEPYLYRYRIGLRGWEAKAPGAGEGAGPIDRFKGDLKSVNTMTLSGIVDSTANLTGKLSSLSGAAVFAPAAF